MKAWKVILATLVIFAAGAVTGVLFTRNASTNKVPAVTTQQADPLLFPYHVQGRFIERMQKELSLTPEQRGRIEKIFGESRERMKIMFEIIGPELKAELRDVQEKVRVELQPEQREKFETLLKQRPHKRSESTERDKSSGKSANVETTGADGFNSPAPRR